MVTRLIFPGTSGTLMGSCSRHVLLFPPGSLYLPVSVRPVMTRRPFAIIFAFGFAIAFASMAGRVQAEDGGADFDRRIGPLLVSRCFECHVGSKPKGGLDLSRRATAFAGGESGRTIVPGKPDESLLWQRVSAGEMPPKKPL